MRSELARTLQSAYSSKMQLGALQIFRKLQAKVKRHLLGAHRVVGRAVEKTNLPLVRLGTHYGGWTFLPTAELQAGGLAVCCGAGEDVSFDIELVRHYGCKVVVVDPTPRAITHFRDLSAALRRGERYPINRSQVDFYDPTNVDVDKISLTEKAIWNESAALRFYVPHDSSHVSHSLVNLQKTDSYIEVHGCPLSEILQGSTHAAPVLIKLDIEGAENVVIRSFLSEGFLPQQILVEFDELNFPSERALADVESIIGLLSENEYRFVHFDGMSNCLFVRSELVPK